MTANVDRLINLLENECIFVAEDIPALNQMLAAARADEIPEQFKSEIIDVIDLMFVCGNVYSETKLQIDSLYDSLSKH